MCQQERRIFSWWIQDLVYEWDNISNKVSYNKGSNTHFTTLYPKDTTSSMKNDILISIDMSTCGPFFLLLNSYYLFLPAFINATNAKRPYATWLVLDHSQQLPYTIPFPENSQGDPAWLYASQKPQLMAISTMRKNMVADKKCYNATLSSLMPLPFTFHLSYLYRQNVVPESISLDTPGDTYSQIGDWECTIKLYDSFWVNR